MFKARGRRGISGFLILLPGSEVIFNEVPESAQRNFTRSAVNSRTTASAVGKKLYSAERFPGLEHLTRFFMKRWKAFLITS